MRRMIFAACLVAVCSPAAANWQFTKWGMSPEQVEAAGKGKAPRITPKVSGGETINNQGTYTSGEHQFNTSYKYRNEKLSEVELELTSPTCQLLKSDLRARYGDPDDVAPLPAIGDVTFWTDVKNGNEIMLFDAPGLKGSGKRACTLTYSPYKKSREGL